MKISRRRFLAWFGILLAVAGVVWTRRRGLGPWYVSAALAGDAPRPLTAATAGTLRATVMALLDPRVEPTHYLEFFRWQSENVPGAGALYERFAAAVDRAARERGAHRFDSAPRQVQQAILAPLTRNSLRTRAWRIVFDRDRARFSRHVVRQVFRRFARTDAWVLAGYAAWPGMPRAVSRLRPAEPRP